MNQQFKAGDLVRAKEGCTESDVGSSWDVKAKKVYTIEYVLPSGAIVLVGSEAKGHAPRRFELVPDDTATITQYAFVYIDGSLSKPFATLDDAVRGRSAIPHPSSGIEVFRVIREGVFTLESKAVPV